MTEGRGLSTVLIAILIASAFIVGGSEYITDVGLSVGAGSFPENISVINKMSEVSSVLSSADSSLRGTETTSTSIWDLPVIFVKGIWSTLKLLFIQLPDIALSMISVTFQILPLPGWLNTLIVGGLWATLIFALLKAGLKIEV